MLTAILLDDVNACNQLLMRQINNGPLAIQVVAQCTTTDQAYDYIQLHVPDLVFTDYRLAAGSGIRFIETLQQLDRFAHLHYILVSGYSSDQLPDFGPVRIDGYLEKPVSRYSYGMFVTQYGHQWPLRNEGPTNWPVEGNE